MADLLRSVPVADLKHLEGGKDWRFAQPIDGLPTLGPVVGHVHVKHQGGVLEVNGEAKTLVSLTCDRCLRPFQHSLSMQNEEVLALSLSPSPSGGDGPQERDRRGRPELGLEGIGLDPMDGDGLVAETLDPRGNFDPERWVFEQLSLQWPLVTRCGADCPGPECWSSQSGSTDPRWSALGQLKQ